MSSASVGFHAIQFKRGERDQPTLVGVILDGDSDARYLDEDLIKATSLLGAETSPALVTAENIFWLPAFLQDVNLSPTQAVRDSAAEIMRRIGESEHLTILLPPSVLNDDAALTAALEGVVLGSYSFTLDTVTSQALARPVRVDVADVASARLERLANRASAFADASMLARDLTNMPGGVLTPTRFVDIAQRHAAEAGIEVTVIEGDALKEAQATGLLAVSRGSHQAARLLELSYRPSNAKLRVAAVGKGVTFDSGGLQLKSADSMRKMKADMAGAAAVLAAALHLPRLTDEIALTAVIPLTDNMPGPDATRPGDIVTYPNGEVVEILSTDAEGRLVLADGFLHAAAFDPDILIDIATLTGACEVALGPDVGGLWSNDDALAEVLLDASIRSGELLWRMPLLHQYHRLLESDLAGIKNLGPRAGGAITAALFLSRFVPDGLPWAHIDMSAPAVSDQDRGVLRKGATGYGARLLLETMLSLPTTWLQNP